ncbi:glycosyltransferase family 25 protein [uncultured Vibrio sp.]|uniref:glycosyltransferase family 25 protein n=1 Tax=uncultured Vibrio sp. TaxID=114054 RepID=UPI002612BBC8|nr:glycosyltransferase family 25 protein [uncultured Vibrio sp.]
MKKIKIYVLTTRDKDRVHRMERLLDGVEFNFVDSLSVDELKRIENKFAKESLKFRKKAIMLGEFGAFSTHSMAWKLVDESNEMGIIIEDSADFVKDASVLFSDDVYNQIINNGLISFTDYDHNVVRPKNKPVLFDDLKLKKAFPIRCYGITPETARTLLEHMDMTGMVQPVDKWMSIYKLSGVSGFLSNIGIAIRAPKNELKSIANARRGKVSFNPLNLIYRRINKIRYKY